VKRWDIQYVSVADPDHFDSNPDPSVHCKVKGRWVRIGTGINRQILLYCCGARSFFKILLRVHLVSWLFQFLVSTDQKKAGVAIRLRYCPTKTTVRQKWYQLLALSLLFSC
jgi:hypothetical protein